jgi:hypothetical protein
VLADAVAGQEDVEIPRKLAWHVYDLKKTRQQTGISVVLSAQLPNLDEIPYVCAFSLNSALGEFELGTKTFAGHLREQSGDFAGCNYVVLGYLSTIASCLYELGLDTKVSFSVDDKPAIYHSIRNVQRRANVLSIIERRKRESIGKE